MLHEIGAGELPVVIVLNKIDRVDPLGRRRLANRFPEAPQVSALTGEGLERAQGASSRAGSRIAGSASGCSSRTRTADGSRSCTRSARRSRSARTPPDGVLVIARLPRRELQRFAPFLIAESRTHRESA